MEWCEIFRTGKHADNKGRTRTFTESDLDNVVAKYDPKTGHEAPICLDHDEAQGVIKGGPAYGWVESLKREGSRLFAKFRQVVPEFAEAVRAGMYKKRSISLYPDGTLRHVAWLGAKPPAVKGMEDFAFSSEETEFFVFSEDVASSDKTNQEENMEIEELKAKLKAEQEARADAEAKNAKLVEENKTLSTNFAEQTLATKRREIEAFIDQGIKDKKLLPAWKEAGLVDFMARLDEQEQTFEFSEGKKAETLGTFFRTLLSQFSEHPLFEDMTKSKKATEPEKGENDGAKLILSHSNYAEKGA